MLLFEDIRNLPTRRYASELMDDPNADQGELYQTFSQLSRINALTLAYWPISSQINHFWRKNPNQRHWDILDLASGNGDTLRHIDQLARKRRRSVALAGLDHSNTAISSARDATPKGGPIEFYREDVLNPRGDYPADLIITSLFMHHLQETEIVHLLQWMTLNARRGWVISDLHRHPVPYVLIQIITFIFGCNAMIRHDSRLSVARSFTRQDWTVLLTQAQLDPTRLKISWYPNFRYVIRYEKNI